MHARIGIAGIASLKQDAAAMGPWGCRFHLVGHDWGAALAWFLATIAPDRVTKLVSKLAPAKKSCSTDVCLKSLTLHIRCRSRSAIFPELGRSELSSSASPAGARLVLSLHIAAENHITTCPCVVRTPLKFSVWIFTELRRFLRFYLSAGTTLS